MAVINRTPKQFERDLLLQLERCVRDLMKTDGDTTDIERGIKGTLRSLTRVRKTR